MAASEPHVEQESEVLSAEDVKALAPLYDNVVLALKQVYDPEIPVNIYDLGLIYELVINKNHEAFIKMTFTAPNCPMADEVLEEVQRNVTDVPGIKACNVELVLTRPGINRCSLTRHVWNLVWMSLILHLTGLILVPARTIRRNRIPDPVYSILAA